MELIKISEEFEDILKKYKDYITEHKLEGYFVDVFDPIESERQEKYIPYLVLLKKLPTPLVTDEVADSQSIGKLNNLGKTNGYRECTILMAGIMLGQKKVQGCLITKDNVGHYNGGSSNWEGRESKVRIQWCCTGSLKYEPINWDSMQEIFSLPERVAYTMRRAGTSFNEIYVEKKLPLNQSNIWDTTPPPPTKITIPIKVIEREKIQKKSVYEEVATNLFK